MQRTTRWTMMAAALVLAGCGGSNDATGPGGGGGGGGGGTAAFSAQVTGDVQSNIEGTASFGSGTDSAGNTLHMIQLLGTGANAGGKIQFARTGAQGFGAGTYPIFAAGNGAPADGDVVAVLIDQNGPQLNAIFAGSGGSITVTSSSGTKVAGLFTFDATGAVLTNPTATLAITVSGTFTADPALGSLTVTSAQVRRSH
jgi:hypothetical protein